MMDAASKLSSSLTRTVMMIKEDDKVDDMGDDQPEPVHPRVGRHRNRLW